MLGRVVVGLREAFKGLSRIEQVQGSGSGSQKERARGGSLGCRGRSGVGFQAGPRSLQERGGGPGARGQFATGQGGPERLYVYLYIYIHAYIHTPSIVKKASLWEGREATAARFNNAIHVKSRP